MGDVKRLNAITRITEDTHFAVQETARAGIQERTAAL
jgi:hypothetical protein